jgi:hypothetical protein
VAELQERERLAQVVVEGTVEPVEERAADELGDLVVFGGVACGLDLEVAVQDRVDDVAERLLHGGVGAGHPVVGGDPRLTLEVVEVLLLDEPAAHVRRAGGALRLLRLAYGLGCCGCTDRPADLERSELHLASLRRCGYDDQRARKAERFRRSTTRSLPRSLHGREHAPEVENSRS